MATIEAVLGDITTQHVDAIVNAANSALLGGGGVDGAIHAAAGPRLLEACRRLRNTTHRDGLDVGDAVATEAGDLPAQWVIHTVGPNKHRGQTDPDLLASCFRRSLQVAREVGARSVAFPAVSAGVYGWDSADVAQIAVAAVRAELGAGPGLEEVTEVSGTGPNGGGPKGGGPKGGGPSGGGPSGGGPSGASTDAAGTGAGGIELVRFVLFSRLTLGNFETALAR